MLLLLASLFQGCELNRREKAVLQKEEALLKKEQELILKEKTLALKENELLQREQQLDSIRTDTTLKYHPALAGQWKATMKCTETTCAGSAVGDTKTEVWEFSFDSSFHLFVKVISGNNVARVYNGSYNGNVVELTQQVPNSAATPATTMSVRLNIVDATTLEGQREIVRENDCRILYSLQLSRQ